MNSDAKLIIRTGGRVVVMVTHPTEMDDTGLEGLFVQSVLPTDLMPPPVMQVYAKMAELDSRVCLYTDEALLKRSKLVWKKASPQT